jgi:hypothetical protein
VTVGEAGRRRIDALLDWVLRTGAKVLRRLVYVHTIDVVVRSTTVPPPAVRNEDTLALHRVTSLDSVLRDAPGQRELPLWRLLRHIRPLEERRHGRLAQRNADRFAQGDIAYVATAGQEVAAWLWLSRGPSVRCRWSGLHFSLEPHEAYIYDLWSYPAHRDAGAGAFVMVGLLEDLYRRGEVTRVYGYILRDNRRNQVLTRIVFGFEQVQRVKDIRVLSRRAWQLPGTDRPPVGPCSRPLREFVAHA